MEIEFSPRFHKHYQKVNVRIRNQTKDRLRIFKKNPEDLQLNNHELKQEWTGYNSIDITSDYRAIYKKVRIDDEIIARFVALGTHEDLYKPSSKN